MWYKFAKQGSLWNRIHPEAEKIFNEIFDNSLISTYKNQKLDIDKFNELFQQSILKDYVSKFIAQNIDSQIAGMFKRTHQEEIKKKFLFLYYTKLNEIKNAIIINPLASNNIIRLRGLLKHEFTHALSNAIMPEYIQNEIYVTAGDLKKKDLGKTIEETNRFMKYWRLIENLHKFPYFESFLKSNYPEYTNYLDPTENRTINKEKLKESAIKFNQYFEHFKNENTSQNKNLKKIRPFDNLESKATPYELTNYQTINQIDFRNIYFETITGKLKSEFIEKDKWNKLTPEQKKEYNPTFQKFLNLLNNRAKTLRSDSDLYSANPDETRSQINEYLEYFNTKNLLEFYNFKFDNNKEEFLNFIKNMFYELIDWKIRNDYPYSDQYENYLGIFFLNEIMNKQYDEKFKRQLAKHFSNTYNIIKAELDKKTQLEQQNNSNIDQT